MWPNHARSCSFSVPIPLLRSGQITEQGVTFAVVQVQAYKVETPQEAEETIQSYAPLFPGMPVVVMAIGIRPNAVLAEEAGIAVNRGIVVDDGLATSTPGVFAIGECAEHRGLCYGLVEPAYEQANVLADHLSGNSAGYFGSVLATNLKVSGVHVFSAGDLTSHEFDYRDAGNLRFFQGTGCARQRYSVKARAERI